MKEDFKHDVELGLDSKPKFLPSKYFYNKKGDALFVKIMNLPEYYLTRCEHEIFENKTQELIDALKLSKDSYFELIELGAGDGTKTKELLYFLQENGYHFDYIPIDISVNALTLLKQDLNKELPDLSVKTKHGDYFDVLKELTDSQKPKVVLFLGSNLGNMNDQRATDYIYKLGSSLQAGDKLILGLDIKKPKEIVLPAYDDCNGVTAEFNLNLLERINVELGGNFKRELFKHQAEYDEKEGTAKSYLVSTANQNVEIKEIGKTYHFEKCERIQTEVSRKYDDRIVNKIIEATDFRIECKIQDNKEYFADYILERT